VDRNGPDPMIGRVLDGRYRVGPRIARGGMATVYEATDLRLDRPCALKVMHTGLGDDEEFAARFVREARHAARLSHPNVVSVFDQGDDDGTIFLAMEYIPGHTLRDLIRKEAPMAPRKALALIEPVLSALAAAHQSGMIHRDVKPENVLLADDGRVKVAAPLPWTCADLKSQTFLQAWEAYKAAWNHPAVRRGLERLAADPASAAEANRWEALPAVDLPAMV